MDAFESAAASLTAEYDRLSARAQSAFGFTPTGPHPRRFVRLAKAEAAKASDGRIGAVLAIAQLAPDEDRRAWCQATVEFQTGSFMLAYFDADRRGQDSSMSHITYHDLYLQRRDEHQSIGTGTELVRLSMLAVLLGRDGCLDAAQRLTDFLQARRPDPAMGFDPRAWVGLSDVSPFKLVL